MRKTYPRLLGLTAGVLAMLTVRPVTSILLNTLGLEYPSDAEAGVQIHVTAFALISELVASYAATRREVAELRRTARDRLIELLRVISTGNDVPLPTASLVQALRELRSAGVEPRALIAAIDATMPHLESLARYRAAADVPFVERDRDRYDALARLLGASVHGRRL